MFMTLQGAVTESRRVPLMAINTGMGRGRAGREWRGGQGGGDLERVSNLKC